MLPVESTGSASISTKLLTPIAKPTDSVDKSNDMIESFPVMTHISSAPP